jgi:hypothetical protein
VDYPQSSQSRGTCGCAAPPGVYTLWWYDEHGMGVKRYHKTTQGEYRVELLAWR